MYLPDSNVKTVWVKVRSSGLRNFDFSVDHPKITASVITYDVTHEEVVRDLDHYHKAGFRVRVTTFGTRFRWEPRIS